MKKFILIVGMVLVLAACTKKEVKTENESVDKVETQEVKETNNEMNLDETEVNSEMEEDEDNNETEDESIAASANEDHFIDGEVILEEEKNNIHIEGKTNLIKGTTLEDRKSTRLNSSHVSISYAVFCLKK